MIRTLAATTATALCLAAPVVGQDAEAGAEVFQKQCATCHVVVNEAGETLAGRKARTGPNLFGVMESPAAAVEDFRYGTGIQDAAEAGLVWNEENFLEYVKDTNAFLRAYTGDEKARSKMSWKVKKDEDALNVHAFLVSLGPAE